MLKILLRFKVKAQGGKAGFLYSSLPKARMSKDAVKEKTPNNVRM